MTTRRTTTRCALALAAVLLGAAAARAGDYDLKLELTDYGVKSLTLPDGTEVCVPFALKIEGVTFEQPDGARVNTAPYVDKLKPAFTREGNTVTLTNWPRARLSCTYEARGDTLYMRLALRNDGEETLRGAQLRPLQLRWPSVPLPFWRFNSEWTGARDEPNGNLHKDWSIYGSVDPEIGPPVMQVKCPGYSLAYRLDDVAAPHVLKFMKVWPAIYIHRSIGPGETLETTVSLKLGPPDADPFTFNRDIFERYEAAWPMMLNWNDRGPYYMANFTESAGNAQPYNPHGYGIVYKIHSAEVEQARQAGALEGYTGEPVITDEATLRRCFPPGSPYYTPPGKTPVWLLPNLRTEVGKALFRTMALNHADATITRMRAVGATGMIHWAIEGVENSGLHYNGDPRRVELRPEMMFKGRDGVTTVDAYFKKFRDAGFKVGNCLRPQVTQETPPQEHATGFFVGAPGRIVKLRAYHTGHPCMEGTHQARLWCKRDGKLLAGPVDLVMRADNPGWVAAAIPPVAVEPGEEYLVSLGTDPGAVAMFDEPAFIAAMEAPPKDEEHPLRRAEMNCYYTTNMNTMPVETWKLWRQDPQDGNKWKPSPGMSLGIDVAFVLNGQEGELTLFDDAQSVKMQPRFETRLERLNNQDAIAEHLISMIRYAKDRWGSELFYIDSTVGDPKTTPQTQVKGQSWELTPDIFRKVHEACPDVLLMPENELTRDHAYSAPFNPYGGRGTAQLIRAAWPGAFTLFCLTGQTQSNMKQYWDKPEHREAFIAAIRQGDIFMVDPYNSELIREMYRQAGRPPVAYILVPAQGTEVTAGQETEILARAEDADGTIVKVEFFVSTITDGRRKIGEATQAPYTVKWCPERPGRYVLTIRAEDDAGLERWPGAVVVQTKEKQE